MSSLDKHFHKAYEFFKKVAIELGLPAEEKDKALYFFRVVVHPFRDRLSPEEVVDVISELPVLVKGLFVEGWKTARKPVKRYHKLNDFWVDIMHRSMGQINSTEEAERVARAVLGVIRHHVSPGEWNDVVKVMPEEISKFLRSI